VLRLEAVRCAYGKVEALKGVSLEVRAGELVTLIGANGAGKSTTLKAISGLVHPKAGRILFEDTEITHRTPEDILRLGVAHCPEGRRVFPQMTVTENLEMGAYVRRAGRDVAADMEAIFGHFPILEERERQLAGTLSGGEQQMLAIGRGLMARPKLLLLDEPSTGLAPLFVKEMYHQLSRLKEEGLTILLAEQQVPHALAFSERAYVLENGEIRLFGKSKDLLGVPEIQRTYLGVT